MVGSDKDKDGRYKALNQHKNLKHLQLHHLEIYYD